jgi:hypothetical protein
MSQLFLMIFNLSDNNMFKMAQFTFSLTRAPEELREELLPPHGPDHPCLDLLDLSACVDHQD